MSDGKFNYTYSAPNENERREIESIKKQYTGVTEKEDKLNLLRSLNRRVHRPPLIISVAVGIIGTLVFGLGMTMVLEWGIVLWGVIAGAAGILLAAAAYPVYKAVLKRNKQKYGARIVALSNELLNEDDDEQ